MSNAEIRKITKSTIKALEKFSASAARTSITPAERENRLLLESRASVAIEHPEAYGNNS